MKKNNRTLSIFNYEGDAIWIEKTPESVEPIKVYDQFSKVLETTTIEGFFEFVEGRRNITDSLGKTWCWPDENNDGRNSIENIINFLQKS